MDIARFFRRGLAMLLPALGLLLAPPAAADPPPAPPPQIASALAYSTFLGGDGNDCFPRCVLAVDGGGSVYIAGHTASADFPPDAARFGAGGAGDVFLLKINPDGDRLVYAVRLGGSEADYATAIAVDADGNAYVAGYTASADFPATGGKYAGGFADAFVVKLNPQGNKLLYATLLGGGETDRAYGLAVDARGRAFLTGETHSDDFPVTPDAPFPLPGGNGDAFLVRLNPKGNRVTFATYLGGAETDRGEALAVDALGEVYLAGFTLSDDFPVTAGAFQTTPGGRGDAFAARLTPAGGTLAYATYLGGDSVDRAEAIAVDADGNAYLTGATLSDDFPVTAAAFHTEHAAGFDAFALKLNAGGSALAYSTLLGGAGGDRGYAIAVDADGSAHIAGATYSADFPITPDAFDSEYSHGYADAFAARLLPDGSALTYATFLGGGEPDFATGIALDGEGSIYLTGAARSPAFPVTVRSADPDHNGAWDGFAAKISFRGGQTASFLSGIVRDAQGNPLPGVIVSAGSSGSTTADANGVYALIGLDAGTYTLTPAKPGYTFTPPRRTVNVPSDEALFVFTGVPQGDPPAPFLDLPLDYGDTTAAFAQVVQDTENQGWITSWFDHAFPTYAKDRQLVLADGRARTRGGYNLNLGCYEHRCYDGHDGIDFVFRDFRPGLTAMPTVRVFAAADGVVAATRANCAAGNRRCGDGFGNQVVLDHRNGYFTLYGHLSSVRVKTGQRVKQGDVLGTMGNTGNSSGFHLHFGLYHDDGNGAWDGYQTEKPVDPFGWQGEEADPWVVEAEGPASLYLWQHPLSRQTAFVGKEGASLTDPTAAIEATIPPGAFDGQTRLSLTLSPVPDAPAGRRTVGRAFRLAVLEWLPANRAAADSQIAIDPASALAKPITLQATYKADDVRHLNAARLQWYRWDEAAAAWQALPSEVDGAARRVTARTASLGRFSLQAPLLCPADAVEPDDNYFAARQILPNGDPLARLFDSAGDEDWFYFEALAGTRYTLATDDLGRNVDTQIELYDLSDGRRLAQNDNGGTGEASRLTWVAPAGGTVFVRVLPAGKSATGCRAAYSLSLTAEQRHLYLPLVTK